MCYFKKVHNIKLLEVVIMNEFRVELFIDSGENEKIEFSSMKEKEKEKWKKDMEERALSEYHNKKIKIST